MARTLLYESLPIDLRSGTTPINDLAQWEIPFPASVDFPLAAYSAPYIQYEWEFSLQLVTAEVLENVYRTRQNVPVEKSLGRWTGRAGNKVAEYGAIEFEEQIIRGKSNQYNLLNSFLAQPFLYSSIIPPRFYARNTVGYNYCLEPLFTSRPTTVVVPAGGLGTDIYDGEFGVAALQPPPDRLPPININLLDGQEISILSGILYPLVVGIGQLQIFYSYAGLPVIFATPRQIDDPIPPPGNPVQCTVAGLTVKTIDAIIAEICACANPPGGCTAEQIAICASMGLPCPCTAG